MLLSYGRVLDVDSLSRRCRRIPYPDGPLQHSETDVADLVQVVEDAAVAYIRGDMDTYLSLIVHADDYTLMPPFGGDTVRGFDHSPDAISRQRDFFGGGDAAVELDQSYVSGDLAVLVVVERQHGEVGDLPDQDWSLRVTLVFGGRRRAGRWLTAMPTY